MAVRINNYVDIVSRTLMLKGSNASFYDQLVAYIIASPKFQEGILKADSGLSEQIKQALSDFGNSDTVGEALETIALAAISPMVAIEHGDLVQLAAENRLLPGLQYRITDYVATVSDNDTSTQSAGHPFDIIVTADSTSSVSETARAERHAGDAYFPAETNFSAWRLQYSIYNDAERFGWANENIGKGVVYRMVDEFGNDCPYDFKGIMFKPYGSADNVCRYTFDSGDATNNEDRSIGIHAGVYENTMSPFIDSGHYRALNRITMLAGDDGSHGNSFGVACRNITLGKGSSNNFFGPDCRYVVMGDGCSNNVFRGNNSSVTFGNASAVKPNYNNIAVGPGVQYVYLDCTYPSLSSATYRNVELKCGISGKSYERKWIQDPNADQTWLTIYKPANSEETEV